MERNACFWAHRGKRFLWMKWYFCAQHGVCKKKKKADSEQCLMSFLLSHSNSNSRLYATVSTPQQNKHWWTCIHREMHIVGEPSSGMRWRVPSVWLQSELCLLLISVPSRRGLLCNAVQTQTHRHAALWNRPLEECCLKASASDLVSRNALISFIHQRGRGQTNSPRLPHKLKCFTLFTSW